MQKELSQKLLRELLKNSKGSDRELPKLLKVSQPTITRTRPNLEKDGTIQDHTTIPNFEKIGFELLAFTSSKMLSETHPIEAMTLKHEETKNISVNLLT